MTEALIFTMTIGTLAGLLGLAIYYTWGKLLLKGHNITPYAHPPQAQKVVNFIIIYPILFALLLAASYVVTDILPDNTLEQNKDTLLQVVLLTISLVLPLAWGLGIGRKWYRTTVATYNEYNR